MCSRKWNNLPNKKFYTRPGFTTLKPDLAEAGKLRQATLKGSDHECLQAVTKIKALQLEKNRKP